MIPDLGGFGSPLSLNSHLTVSHGDGRDWRG